ncbi:DUF748 domain-containing protein [Geomonas sp. Red69]|uniref:DUF748 domain-containing protein n=1 Tax=Geomonas diazotrophica TaxID=2843197 RepID=UPI001C10F642|nr:MULTISPECIES: DUF748 domain-containing protein [Geomonas]MBU5635786.1 DUF748 domain-containing protein [Geomonas diazotrophica]QXE87111.1 DUF748 domain-containing protein [Geomonas nitrogeniifigens]
MPKIRRYAVISIAVIAVLALFIATILPIIVKNKAVAAIEDATGRAARIGSVSINPLTLHVAVRDFAVAEKTGPPLIAFRALEATVAPASIFKRTLILSELTLDTPTINLVRTAPNRFNFSDIIERQPKEKQTEKKEPTRFSLNNITIKNGSMDFDDRIVDGGRKHSVRSLNVAIPFISNSPYLAEKYVDPRVSAVINGAPFNFAGKLKPLSKSLETSVHIGLKELSLPQYVAYSPVKPPVDLTSGKLTVDLDLAYRISADKKPELTLKGVTRVDGVAVDLPGGKPLLRLPLLEVKAAKLEALARNFQFESISASGLELFVERNQRGEWMYSRLIPPAKKQEEPKKATEAEQKTVLLVPSFSLSKATVHFRDDLPKGGFKTTVSDIELSARNVSTVPGTAASYQLSLKPDDGATLKTEGKFSAAPLSVTSSLQLAGLRLQRAWPYLSQYLTAPVQGTVGLAAEVGYSESSGVTLQKGNLTVAGLAARYGSKEGFDLAVLQVKDASFGQSDNRLEIGEIRLSQGSMSLSKEADGKLSLLSLFADQPAAKAPAQASSPVAASPRKGTSSPVAGSPRRGTYVLKQLQLEKLNFAFTDKTFEEPPRFTLRNTNLTLSNLQGPKFAPAPLRFSATYGKGAALKLNGTVTPAPFRYRGNVGIARLPIADFEPYFPDSFNFSVIGGSLDTTLNLDLALKDGKAKGSFRGNAGVRDFHSIDAVGDQDLLKWESLQFDEFQGNFDPFVLNIREVALNDVYSRIIIRRDGTLNLQDMVKKEPAAPPAPLPATVQAPAPAGVKPAPAAATVAAAQAPAAQAPAAQRQVSVGSVTIQNGTLAFTDNHLPQTFNSTFYNLGGRVSGLSSEESKFADVDLRGNLENHSPMQITGRLNPLRDDLFVDLKVSFRDIELSPVTPYSGTYLGYAIDKGKLFLDLKYLIERKQLTSENKVFIDQFTFGKKVDSSQATSLPVRLAVALLKDRNGEIHLDLPVTGRTDDPQFSIWGLIGQVLKNLLVKAATSPFALLSSLGGSGQDFSVINFQPGSSELPADEEKKLTQLAKVVADRPGLKLEIKGFVDKGKDPEGYRQELLTRKVKNEKFLHLVKEQQTKEGESSENVQLSAEEYSKYLKAVYKKEKFPKPRNALGMVKDLPDNEMKKLIVANTVVGENELQSLARERSANVIKYLVAKGGLPPEKLFQASDNIYKAPEKETANRSRVEFNAIAR